MRSAEGINFDLNSTFLRMRIFETSTSVSLPVQYILKRQSANAHFRYSIKNNNFCVAKLYHINNTTHHHLHHTVSYILRQGLL